MRRLAAALAALGLAATACAQTPAVLGNLEFASDTDGFHASRFRTGGLYPYTSWFDHLGAAAQTTHYSQGGWSRDANAVLGIWRNQAPATLAGVNAEAGVVQVAGHTRGVGDATWGFRPAADTGIELIAAGDLVATQKAIDRAIAYGFFAASVEQSFAERFTAIGLLGYQTFTDGNDRLHFLGRVSRNLALEPDRHRFNERLGSDRGVQPAITAQAASATAQEMIVDTLILP